MIKPIRIKEVIEPGWYMHIDVQWREAKPHSLYHDITCAWLYEYCPEEKHWRSPSGHLCTNADYPFDDKIDFVIGPIDVNILKGNEKIKVAGGK